MRCLSDLYPNTHYFIIYFSPVTFYQLRFLLHPPLASPPHSWGTSSGRAVTQCQCPAARSLCLSGSRRARARAATTRTDDIRRGVDRRKHERIYSDHPFTVSSHAAPLTTTSTLALLSYCRPLAFLFSFLLRYEGVFVFFFNFIFRPATKTDHRWRVATVASSYYGPRTTDRYYRSKRRRRPGAKKKVRSEDTTMRLWMDGQTAKSGEPTASRKQDGAATNASA